MYTGQFSVNRLLDADPARRGRVGLGVLPAVAEALSVPTCPIPEVARLKRILRAWRSQVLGCLDTDGLSTGGSEALNMLIEEASLLASGYRDSHYHRLRMLVAVSGTAPDESGTPRP